MERAAIILRHELSDLPGLQRAAVLEYHLDWEDERPRLSLRQSEENWERQETLPLSCSWQEACLLLRFLQENAVRIENWREIAEDCQQKFQET